MTTSKSKNSSGGKKTTNHRDNGDGSTLGLEGGFMATALKVLVMCLIVPPMINYGGLSNEKDFFTREIIKYDIGFGQKLYMRCLGSGTPTIILDSPTGTTSDIWIKLQQKMSKLTQVCVYDRAGMGLSDPSPQFNMSDPGEGAVAKTLGPPNTAIRMVSDLHRLVTFTNPLDRPLLLVGSELGALIARTYAHLHPQDVLGLVLIDPLSETLFNELSGLNEKDVSWVSYWYGHLVISIRMLQVAAFTGLSRLGLLTGYLSTPPFSDDELAVGKLKHQLCDPFHLQAVIDEHRYVNVSFQQVDEIRSAWPLPANISTTVVTGTFYDDQLAPSLNRAWSRAVQEVIYRLPGSKHVVMNGADRNIIYKQPDDLVPVLSRIVKKWRNSNTEKE